ncbi:MAG: lysophospholipase [Burkholderiales bacterium]|jgi:alpha-beta hydrolase superfamily lysophospholipase|nr:lysophospholipase [Burkholderiales bacterium]
MTLHTLAAADAVPLQWREWPCAPARGTVLVVHGLGEHIGRYHRLAARLNACGWRVVGHDQRGHGSSGGARGDLPRADAMLDDLSRVIDAVRIPSGGPLLLLGHSLGGLIASRFVAEGLAAHPAPWWRKVDALVLSSPALDPGMNGAKKLLLAVFGRLAPHLAVNNGLKPAWISRDASVVRAYLDDPLVHDRVTPALVRCIVDAGEQVRRLAPAWNARTLLLYAGSDRCVAPAGSAAFAAAAPANLTAREFPSLFHEIFNEPERDEVFAALQSWLDALTAA